MLQKIHRIVTGHNGAGKATILLNDHAPNATPIKGWPGLGVTEIWVTDEMPVSNDGSMDRSMRPMRHDPTPSGTIFRVVEIPPESAGTKIDASATFGQLGSTHQPSAADSAKHPTMHKTDSIDYLVVISGSMHMLMEEGEVRLHRATRRQSCLGQSERKALPVGRGVDRRQGRTVNRTGSMR